MERKIDLLWRLEKNSNRELAKPSTKTVTRSSLWAMPIFSEPELGYKEFKTAEKVKKAFDEMGYTYTDGHAITGIIAPLKGGESKVKVAIMGELDAVVAPNHRCANKETGRCPLLRPPCSDRLYGRRCLRLQRPPASWKSWAATVVLMAVPAEEYVELGYRNELRQSWQDLVPGRQAGVCPFGPVR